jgi:hypothetical protein
MDMEMIEKVMKNLKIRCPRQVIDMEMEMEGLYDTEEMQEMKLKD